MLIRWFMVVALSLSAVVGSSQDDRAPDITILIAYDSRSGNTETFANAVAAGVGTVSGVRAIVRKQTDVDDSEIVAADGVLIGTPVHWGNLSTPTRGFIDRIGGALASKGELGADSTPGNRTGGAFVTGGSVSSGKELARIGILASLMSFKFVLVGGEDAGGFGTLGPQATTGPSDAGLSEAELDEARRYGVRFAELTKALKR